MEEQAQEQGQGQQPVSKHRLHQLRHSREQPLQRIAWRLSGKINDVISRRPDEVTNWRKNPEALELVKAATAEVLEWYKSYAQWREDVGLPFSNRPMDQIIGNETPAPIRISQSAKEMGYRRLVNKDRPAANRAVRVFVDASLEHRQQLKAKRRAGGEAGVGNKRRAKGKKQGGDPEHQPGVGVV